MSDNLKEHIGNEREEFEIYSFDSEQGWNEIAAELKSVRKWPVWKMVSAAACVVLVLLGAMIQIPFANGSDELSEVENFYQNEINYKISLVRNQLEDPSILEDLQLMDQAFSELKADLKDNVDNEEVVAAMMENYQLKLRILEEILKELDQENRESSL